MYYQYSYIILIIILLYILYIALHKHHSVLQLGSEVELHKQKAGTAFTPNLNVTDALQTSHPPHYSNNVIISLNNQPREHVLSGLWTGYRLSDVRL
jgi:hypothetical protein